MSVFALGATAAQSVVESLSVTTSRATKLQTKGGVWTVNRAKGTVAFVADSAFSGRDRVGFSVTTKQGIEHQTILTVKVQPTTTPMPVSGNNVDTPITWAVWFVLVGVFLFGLGRVRIRRN